MIPKKVVAAVLERDSGQCVLQLAGCLFEASVADHRVNRGMGGGKVLNDPAALVASCGSCNGRKEDSYGDMIDRLYARGLKVAPDSTHRKSLDRCRLQPVQYPSGEWFFLTSDGLKHRCGGHEF